MSAWAERMTRAQDNAIVRFFGTAEEAQAMGQLWAGSGRFQFKSAFIGSRFVDTLTGEYAIVFEQ